VCAPTYRVDRPNGFFCHGLEYVADGKGTYHVDTGRRHPLHAGAVFYYSPGSPHRIDSDPQSPLVKYFVDFIGDPALDLLRQGPLHDGKPVYLANPDHVRRLFEDMQMAGERATAFSPALCSRILELLILHISEGANDRTNQPSAARGTYERCRALLQQHFREWKGLADIASACHVDAAYLCRLFRTFGGQPPHKTLMLLKMRRSAELLATGKLMVKEVALDVGFEDPYHFSRVFKRVHGVSPGLFLKKAETPSRPRLPEARTMA
jgi:AraC-like DNA-binding protein